MIKAHPLPQTRRKASGVQQRHVGRLSLAGLAAIMVTNAIVSFPHLRVLPVFDDEAIFVWYAHVAAHAHRLSDLFGSFNYAAPPLFIWLGAIALHFNADQLVAVRSVSVLCGMATLVAIYLLAWQLYQDVTIGLLAAALCAFCPYEFMFDRMALLDPLVQLIGVLVAIQSVRLYRRQNLQARQAVLLGVLLGLGQLAKGTSTFFWLLPLLSWYVFDPCRVLSRLKRGMLIAAPVAGALYSVILASGNVRNLLRPFFTIIKYSIATPYSGYYASHPHIPLASRVIQNLGQWVAWQQTYVGDVLFGALLVAVAVCVVAKAQADTFLLLWLSLPLAAMLIAKIYTSRYILFTIPIELLLVSRVVVAMLSYARQWTCSTAMLLQGHRVRLTAMGMAGALVALGMLYTAVFDVSRIAALRNDPATGHFVPEDRWQYIAGWPSGYGLDGLESYIRRQAKTKHVVVVAAPAHQPSNALLYGLADNAHIQVRPTPLTQSLRSEPGMAAGRAAIVAVLDIPKDSLRAVEAAHPDWKPHMRQLKPGGQSQFVLLSND
jgi:4-amino-4-deoxy-L-arabinose transferase-like glycosyltransferase